MPSYYDPLRSESTGAFFDIPFLTGFSRTADGKIVLLRAFSTDLDHNPLILEVLSEEETPEGTRFELSEGWYFTLKSLTAEYILSNKDLYPFASEQLLSLLQPGVLSLFTQAALPQWYEETYAPPDEQG